MAKRRTTPELNLQPELPKVLSQDFNLFYKPQVEPEVAGMEEFTKSLDAFVNQGLTKKVLADEKEEQNLNILFLLERGLLRKEGMVHNMI